MITTNLDPAQTQDMIQTLEHIEILASTGAIPGVLTGITALLLRHELVGGAHVAETLERAADFVIRCEQQTKAKVA